MPVKSGSARPRPKNGRMIFRGPSQRCRSVRLPDGSWRHASQPTVERLFGLHLTVRAPDPQIENALRWLITKVNISQNDIQVYADADTAIEPLKGLPFVMSRPAIFLTGATLFLATIFGLERDPEILSIYRRLGEAGQKSEGWLADRASCHNIFRALVVHPDFAQDSTTARVVDRLADLQTDRADWGNDNTFYQTLNALAHLKSSRAAMQLEGAFKRLINTQNKDGTWSLTEPEWNTFLAVHALRSQEII